MTADIVQSQLKNITDDWFEKNKSEISAGSTVNSPSEMLNYERRLFALLIELGAMILALILKARIEDKEFQETTGHEFMKNHPKKYRHLWKFETPVRTLFGNIVKVWTRMYVRKRDARRRQNGRNGSSVYPALEALGIFHGVTPALASDITREVTEGPSFDAALGRLARRCITIDKKTVKRVCEDVAQRALSIRKTWLENCANISNPLISVGESLRNLRVFIGVDGGKSRIRNNKRGRIPDGYKRHGYTTFWREPKILVIRVIDDAGDVVRDISPVYDGTFGNADAIFDLLKAHLKARNIDEALEIVCACDGAPWIWERMGKMFQELGVDPDKLNFCVDYFHAVEHLVAVADGKRSWSKKTRTQWLNRMKELLIAGEIEALCAELSSLMVGRSARVARKEMLYFETHKERMRYNVLLKKKLPIGSGATESAVRQTINMRLKGAGMFWLRKNAEGILHLRCYFKAGRWDAIENAVFASGIMTR